VRPTRVFGVDFSGAQDAGKRIWIAAGLVEDDALSIRSCRPAGELRGSGAALEPCLDALRKFIAAEKEAVFGLDFPFGLPRQLVQEPTWEDFLTSFPEHYQDPEAFRRACLEAAGGKELKRCTDLNAKTPFCCYNLRLYKQTFHGIAGLLSPLVQQDRIRVPPMQDPEPGKPRLVEICPASTLKRLGLYKPYKNNTDEQESARAEILSELEKGSPLEFPDQSVRNTVLADSRGDALDSVIAACAAFELLQDPGSIVPQNHSGWMLEGYV
jgi:hypothetical protein